MKKNMKFAAHNGVNIVFDDWNDEVEEYGTYWGGMCQECFNKFKNILGDRVSDGSGCCSVKGCENEADYYVDFLKNEVAFE